MAQETLLPLNINDINPALCVNSKLRRLARISTNIYEKHFKQFGLRSSQVSILLMVGKMGTINQKDVADFLFVDYSTMSRDLNKLKERDFIKLTKGGDARHTMLELTAGGHKLLEGLVPVWKQTNDEIEAQLGTFSIAHIDVISQAMKPFTTR
nr:MarR family winged helix-turn-helix transcriptional regulator [uncultured Mucilaginibacter sp.]